MLRIGICDDELNARESLRFALEPLLEEKTEQIVYEFSSGRSATSWIAKHPGELDLLFLDIEMKEMDGMNTALEIRKYDSSLLIVFATGYADYVFDGYRVNALDYLLKPIKKEKLQQVLARVRTLLSQNENDVFIFHNTDGTYRISYFDILYFYSEKRMVYLVTAKKEYAFYEKLDHIEAIVNHEFVRIHQRYLVNASHVDFIGSSHIAIDDIQLPLSRSQKADSVSKLARLMLGGNCHAVD